MRCIEGNAWSKVNPVLRMRPFVFLIVAVCLVFLFEDFSTKMTRIIPAKSTLKESSRNDTTIQEITMALDRLDPNLTVYSKLPHLEDVDPCSPEHPLSCVLALGLPRMTYVMDHFPIVISRMSSSMANNEPRSVKIYVNAIEKAVIHYGIQLIFDTDQSRPSVSKALLQKQLSATSSVMKNVQIVHNHIFAPRFDLRRVDYLMDYSPKYNLQSGLVPRSPQVAQKMIWRPYANMRYDVFLNESSQRDYSKLVSSIIARKPFVLACGSNRRDYTGAILAAENTGMNLIIADTRYKKLKIKETPHLKLVNVSHAEFNVLLTHASFVIVPSALPQTTPVGIGTLARTKMARKIPIAVNNTGTDTMITHGVDGYFVPDPSAEHEVKFGSYQKIFEELQDENRRREIEGNIQTMAHSDEVAGVQMVHIARCLGSYSSLNRRNSTMFELHHVNDCHACGRNDWCDFWLFSDPQVGVEGKYGNVGPTLEDSCEKIKSAAIVQVVKNSISGKIYVAAACSAAL